MKDWMWNLNKRRGKDTIGSNLLTQMTVLLIQATKDIRVEDVMQ